MSRQGFTIPTNPLDNNTYREYDEDDIYDITSLYLLPMGHKCVVPDSSKISIGTHDLSNNIVNTNNIPIADPV